MLFLLQETHRFLERDARRFVQIRAQSGGQIIRRGFDPRQFDRLTLVYDELQRRFERDLNRAAIDLAVALDGVAVTGKKLPASIEHRQKQRSADAGELEIDVSAPRARRRR